MRFLERKNQMFFNTARELIEENRPFEVQIWTEDKGQFSYDELKAGHNSDYYYDLIVINFDDEEGYERSMTMPVPLLFESRMRGAYLLREWLKQNWNKIIYADRQCYERFGHRIPISSCDEDATYAD